MPAVSIERVPVQTLHLGLLGFDHLQIVFRPVISWPRQEDWYVIEGVRDVAAGGVQLAVEGWHGGTTLAEANGGRVGAALSDRIGTSATRGARVIAEGEEAVRVWSTFVSYAAEIDAQRFPYIALALPASPIPTINSSSLVASLLHYAGIDPAGAAPAGLRLSPGMTTLLGTSRDDTLHTGPAFTTLVAGDGDDTLFGSSYAGRVEKLFGGRGNDTFHWSAGLNIIHGGQPGLAYAEDGTDTVDYTGIGVLRIEAVPQGEPHQAADFIVRHAWGEDRLHSIEEIVWDAARDSVSLGAGVALAPRTHAGIGKTATERTEDKSGPTLSGARLVLDACTADDATLPDDPDLEVALACDIWLCGSMLGDPAPAVEVVLDIGHGG